MILSLRSAVLLGLSLISLPEADASPYVISDDRVRSLDVTPVLGRGYSIMTNSFQSTCLMVSETTVPSYNYKYNYEELQTTDDDASPSAPGTSIRDSFAYWNVYSKWKRVVKPSSARINRTTKMITASMRLERYYSSLREEVSPLSADAATLLQEQDYVGFFQACGPNYVRGIRRAQEVTAIFEFESETSSGAQEYTDAVKQAPTTRNLAARVNRSGSTTTTTNTRIDTYVTKNTHTKSTFNKENESVKITIYGYGLGLGDTAAEALVANNIEEFHQVMKYAFQIMTQSANSYQIGQVYGMEIVPWVDNISYQVTAGITEESIEIPLPRSLIPKAIRIDGDANGAAYTSGTGGTRDEFRCKDPSLEMDKYSYCCELNSMFDTDLQDYNAQNPETKICKPQRTLDKSIVKNNLAGNGEFVARLERAVRYKMNQLSTLQACVSAARSFPKRYDYHILKPIDTVKYDESISPDITVFELQIAVDPFNDFSMVKHMAKELDEFIDMYYAPCLAALFGTAIGNNPDTDPTFFMAYPWHTHPECLHLSCLGENMRWDRTNGGCKVGMISGVDSTAYSVVGNKNETDDSENRLCSYDTEYGDDAQRCKYPGNSLAQYQDTAVNCWSDVLPAGQVLYYLNNYCLPQITDQQLTYEDRQDLDTKMTNADCTAPSA